MSKSWGGKIDEAFASAKETYYRIDKGAEGGDGRSNAFGGPGNIAARGVVDALNSEGKLDRNRQ